MYRSASGAVVERCRSCKPETVGSNPITGLGDYDVSRRRW